MLPHQAKCGETGASFGCLGYANRLSRPLDVVNTKFHLWGSTILLSAELGSYSLAVTKSQAGILGPLVGARIRAY